MKRIVLMSLLLVCVMALPVLAEETPNLEAYEEYPGLDFGGGTGFIMGYMDLDLSDLNNSIKDTYPELTNGIMVFGSTNFLGFKEGMRWGSSWFMGVKKNTGDDGALSQLTMSFGGLDVNYGKVLHEQVDVTFGGLLGVGSYDLTLRKENLTEVATPNTIHLTNIFFTVGPKVTLDFYVTEQIALRGTAGYIYGIGSSKWLDVSDRIDTVPALSMKGAMAGLDFSFVY